MHHFTLAIIVISTAISHLFKLHYSSSRRDEFKRLFHYPHLSIRYFTENCNHISYISATISYELQLLHSLSLSWLKSQDVGPLPEITDLKWLSSHVMLEFVGLVTLTGLTMEDLFKCTISHMFSHLRMVWRRD